MYYLYLFLVYPTYIYYILTSQIFNSDIIRSSTRTYTGADINSDNDMIMCENYDQIHYTKIN